ncbi:MAG: S9 family peptidase, partial [Actinomycetota bacterium]
MTGPTTAPYGTWPSPLSAAVLAEAGVRIAGPAVRGDEVWWAEMRPTEAGRVVLVRNGVDALPPPWSARTLVHEYGGGAWWLGATAVYFTHFDDQRLHRLDEPGGDPVPLTPEPPAVRAWRYADGREHPSEPWLVAVRERHSADGSEAVNELVAIAADIGPDTVPDEPRVIGVGTDGAPQADFVAAPRCSPDGRWLSWFRWNHPDMPWDGTELCVAPVFGGLRTGNVQVVAGGRGESIHGADWTSDGRLVFSTDRSGRWNLHAWRPGSSGDEPLTALT